MQDLDTLIDSRDFTDKIGSLANDAPWPMYSFNRPAYMLWDALANGLCNRGWTDEQIKEWLQSKGPRWALDGSLGDKLKAIAHEYANTIETD